MSQPSPSFFSAPLADALHGIGFRLKHEGMTRVIVATPRMSELCRNEMPSHVQVTSRPLKGRRIVSRNVRHFKQTRLRVAHHPESRMDETAVPELLYIISGMAKIAVGDYVLQCHPGDFVLIPPMVPKGSFSYAVDDNLQSVCDVLHIYSGRLLGEGLECWIAHCQGEKIETSTEIGAALFKDTFLATFFDRLCDEMKHTPGSETTYYLVNALVLMLHRDLNQGRALRSYIRNPHPPEERIRDPIQYALTYIESHLDTPLTIDSLARKTALSTTSFKHLFRQVTGNSFHQYLIAQRLKFAEQLLRETDARVQEVAERVGLSPSQLHRLFQARYSCSPGEYRKKK